MTLSDGDRLGPWLIEGSLGSGPMFVVHRALDLRLRRRVALKVFVDELASSRSCGDKLQEAAAAGASLAQRGVVPIFEGGRQSDVAYVSSGLVEGPDLGTLLARTGSLPPARALAILGQVAEALDEAHSRDVIHGGVKPTNVLLRWSQIRGAEEAYVSDFAVTRLVGPAAEPLLGRGLGPGFYLAPEQTKGVQLGPGTDVYLLGCLLYECLTGHPPVPRADGDPVSSHLGTSPPAPSSVRPELIAFDEVVHTAMAEAPEDRHPSCRHLIGHAKEALARPWTPPQRIWPAPQTPVSVPPPSPPMEDASDPIPTPEPAVARGPESILLSAIAALAALGLGVLLLFLISGSLQKEPDAPRSDLSGGGIEEILRYELERNMGTFIAAQQRLVERDDLGGVEGLVPIHEGGEDLQLGALYTDAASSEDVTLVVATYAQAVDAEEAFETERAERGGTISRQMTPSGLLATVLSKDRRVSMIWHVDKALFVISADGIVTVQRFFDQLPKAVRLGPL
jgi:serine/threonine protein kinase